MIALASVPCTPGELLRWLDVHSHHRVRFILARGKAQAGAGAPRLVDAIAAGDAMDAGYSVKIALSSARMIAVDVDDGLDAFAQIAGDRLAGAPFISRANAPTRGKWLAYMADGEDVPALRREAPGRRVEVLRRDATIAGLHPSGAPYVARWDGLRVPVLTMTEIEAWLDAFAGPAPAPTARPSAARSSVPHSMPVDASPVRAAIAWWSSDPANVAQVQARLAKLPSMTQGSRTFYALRREQTPSLTASSDHDGRPTWVDFGERSSVNSEKHRTFDAFELAVLLGVLPGDKRRAVAQVVDAFTRARHGVGRSEQRRAELAARR